MENGDGVMKLKSCDESDSKQKLSGFKSGGSKFELFVGGDSSKLISQGHDPKSHEKLQLVKKDTARGDHTNFWQVLNPSGSSSSGGQSSSAVSKNSKPPIDFRGSNYCTRGNPCSLCQGDCDVSNHCRDERLCKLCLYSFLLCTQIARVKGVISSCSFNFGFDLELTRRLSLALYLKRMTKVARVN